MTESYPTLCDHCLEWRIDCQPELTAWTGRAHPGNVSVYHGHAMPAGLWHLRPHERMMIWDRWEPDGIGLEAGFRPSPSRFAYGQEEGYFRVNRDGRLIDRGFGCPMPIDELQALAVEVMERLRATPNYALMCCRRCREQPGWLELGPARPPGDN
jgi:hypothetical protein